MFSRLGEVATLKVLGLESFIAKYCHIRYEDEYSRRGTTDTGRGPTLRTLNLWLTSHSHMSETFF